MKYNSIAVLRKDKEDKAGLCRIYINAYFASILLGKFSTVQMGTIDCWTKQEEMFHPFSSYYIKFKPNKYFAERG